MGSIAWLGWSCSCLDSFNSDMLKVLNAETFYLYLACSVSTNIYKSGVLPCLLVPFACFVSTNCLILSTA